MKPTRYASPNLGEWKCFPPLSMNWTELGHGPTKSRVVKELQIKIYIYMSIGWGITFSACLGPACVLSSGGGVLEEVWIK